MSNYLFVRRYAPFATFGGGFEGDNRTGASTSPVATARTIGVVEFGPTGVTALVGFSTGSTFEGAGPWLAEKIGRHFSKVKSEVTGLAVSPRTLGFTVQTAGANPLVPVVAPDIDTFVDFNVSFGENTRYWGTVRGDSFPNAEVFVVDEAGREILLFDFRTGGGRNTGPMTRLAGAHARQTLGSFDVTIVAVGPQLRVQPTYGT